MDEEKRRHDEEQKLAYRQLSKLQWGSKVVPTERAYKNGVFKEPVVGMFLGLYKGNEASVCVIVIGKKTSYKYWIGFWKPLPVSPLKERGD